MRNHDEERRRTIRIMSFVGAGILIAAILWIDIATGIWQELVILAGLAAGLVSFLLTALVLNRIVAREAARRWEPVNRLAISEFLHAIADEEASEIAHGIIVARTLPEPPRELTGITTGEAHATGEHRQGSPLASRLRALRETVAQERRDLSDALSRWADFLTTSGDNETVLRHIAEIAFRLDQVRDAALELEEQPAEESRAALEREVEECNARFAALVAELKARLALTGSSEHDHGARARHRGASAR